MCQLLHLCQLCSLKPSTTHGGKSSSGARAACLLSWQYLLAMLCGVVEYALEDVLLPGLKMKVVEAAVML